MKNKILKHLTLLISSLAILTACGGDGKNGVPSEYNLLEESAPQPPPPPPTPTPPPTPPTPTPPPPPQPEPVDPNKAPDAEIGGPFFTILTGSATVNLDGNGSSDPEGKPITYYWSLLNKPSGSDANLSSVTGKTTSLDVKEEGVYRVVLMVRDGKKNSPLDTTYILYKKPEPENTPPTAIAYVPQGTVMVNPDKITDVIMDGSFSTDDGLIDPLKYTWSNESGSLSEARAKLEFSCSDDWQLCYGDKQEPICTFTNTLTVNDGELSDSTDLIVTVDYTNCATPPVIDPPVAVVSYVECYDKGDTINQYWHQLDGSGSTGDDLTYTWSIYLDGSLDDADRTIEPYSTPPAPLERARFKVDRDAPGIGISAVLIKLTVTNSVGESSAFVSAFPALCAK